MKQNTPTKNGPSLRATIEAHAAMARRRGTSEEEIAGWLAELTPVELEPGTEYLLELFDTLHRTRPRGIDGNQPITYSEIKAYCELSDTALEPWELSALRVMDNALLQEAAAFQ